MLLLILLVASLHLFELAFWDSLLLSSPKKWIKFFSEDALGDTCDVFEKTSVASLLLFWLLSDLSRCDVIMDIILLARSFALLVFDEVFVGDISCSVVCCLVLLLGDDSTTFARSISGKSFELKFKMEFKSFLSLFRSDRRDSFFFSELANFDAACCYRNKNWVILQNIGQIWAILEGSISKFIFFFLYMLKERIEFCREPRRIFFLNTLYQLYRCPNFK